MRLPFTIIGQRKDREQTKPGKKKKRVEKRDFEEAGEAKESERERDEGCQTSHVPADAPVTIISIIIAGIILTTILCDVRLYSITMVFPFIPEDT